MNVGLATTGTAAAAAPAVAPPPTPAVAGPAGLSGVAGLPGSVGLPGTSAGAATVVVAVAELLPGFGSAVAAVTSAGELTLAVFLMTVPGGVLGSTWTTSVIVADAALGIDAMVHVTVVVPAHEPVDDAVEPKVVPAGSASVTVMLPASDGPLLVTVIV